jgi:hypothetical protein
MAKTLRHTLLVPGVFERGIERARSGAYGSAVARLISEAEEVCRTEPPSVLDKRHTPPSGDKRDYFSLSINFWPDPSKEDGLPYIPRDGQVNPEEKEYDRPALERMTQGVDTLAFAYAVTGEERYAEKAASFLRTWFLNQETAMNPNMLFAQFIPGDNVVVPWKEYPARYVPGTNGRKGVYVSFGGVIEDCPLLPVTDCVRLLRKSPHWTDADDEGLRSWYGAYAEWLLTHQHGLDEAACRNNHGSWYWAGIATFLEFAGKAEKAADLIRDVLPSRLGLQIEPDGSQPEELVRAISQSYTAFTINSFVDLALSSERCGFDAWTVETEDGRSIAKAIEWFLPYLSGENPWTWRQIKPFDPASIIGAIAAWKEKFPGRAPANVLGKLGVPPDHRSHLLYDTSGTIHS